MLPGLTSELRCGDVIVHEEFGIGVVRGLEMLPGTDGDAIVLEYAKEGRRLVPVREADRIWRYGAEIDAVTLDSARWRVMAEAAGRYRCRDRRKRARPRRDRRRARRTHYRPDRARPGPLREIRRGLRVHRDA
ncbi:CarD family transcriptional regulator [Sphingomonas sp. 22L2VL55-3]